MKRIQEVLKARGESFHPETVEAMAELVGQCRGGVRILVEEDGVERVHWEKNNLVVNTGRELLSLLVGDATAAPISIIKIGTLGYSGDILTPRLPVATETDLADPSPFAKSQTAGSPTYLYSPPTVYTKFTFCIEKAEANGAGTVAYTEAGLFNASDYMFAIQCFPAIVKNANRKVVFEWTAYF